MPKATFQNLSPDKKNRVLSACKSEFETHPLHLASVSAIVKSLGIARGSFYQYFESLNECFFTILSLENMDIHRLFAQALREGGDDFFAALHIYGDRLAHELYIPSKRALFRNRFLYWTPDLDTEWRQFQDRQASQNKDGSLIHLEQQLFRKPRLDALNLKPFAQSPIESMVVPADKNKPFSQEERIAELIEYTRAIVHQLIQRSFLCDWSPEQFLLHYRLQIEWLEQGLAPRPAFNSAGLQARNKEFLAKDKNQ